MNLFKGKFSGQKILTALPLKGFLAKMSRNQNKYIFLAFLSLFILILDQVTKQIVAHRFFLGESITVIPGFFNLTYVRNTGAAFGLLAKADPMFRVPFFIIMPIIALITIGYLFRKIPKEDWKLSIALSLVIAGAIGNLIDRVMLGYVIDFFDFHWKSLYHFPAFNIADSMICIGVGILTLDLLVQQPPTTEASKENVSHPS